MHIRPPTPEDRPAWDALWRDYLAFYETTLPPEIFEAQWARLMSDDDTTMRGLLLEVDGAPRGLVHYHFHVHGWKLTRVCYLQDLFVRPDLRGTGAGRALIEAVYARADAHGCPDVYWMTQEHNDVARRLYDRIGKCTPFIKYQRA